MKIANCFTNNPLFTESPLYMGIWLNRSAVNGVNNEDSLYSPTSLHMFHKFPMISWSLRQVKIFRSWYSLERRVVDQRWQEHSKLTDAEFARDYLLKESSTPKLLKNSESLIREFLMGNNLWFNSVAERNKPPTTIVNGAARSMPPFSIFNTRARWFRHDLRPTTSIWTEVCMRDHELM